MEDQNLTPTESIFENVFAPTKEDFKEYIKVATQKSYKIRLYCFYAICAVNSAWWFFKSFTENSDHAFFAVLFLFFAASLLVAQIRNRRKLLNATITREKVLNSGKSDEAQQWRVTFYDDRFETTHGSVFQYAQVSKILSSDTFFLLLIEKAVFVLVKKEGFTRGNCEGFRIFLKEKCPTLSKRI